MSEDFLRSSECNVAYSVIVSIDILYLPENRPLSCWSSVVSVMEKACVKGSAAVMIETDVPAADIHVHVVQSER